MDLTTIPQRLQAGFEAVLLRSTQRKLDLNHRNLEQYRGQMLGGANRASAAGADDMLIVGDVTLHQQAAPAPVAVPPKRMGLLGKLITGASLLAGGAWGTALAPIVFEWLRPAAAVVAPTEPAAPQTTVIERESIENLEVLPPVVRQPEE